MTDEACLLPPLSPRLMYRLEVCMMFFFFVHADYVSLVRSLRVSVLTVCVCLCAYEPNPLECAAGGWPVVIGEIANECV